MLKPLRKLADYTAAFLPPIGTFMMTFYVLARCMGYELSILEVLFGPSLLFTLLLIIMSCREHHSKFFNLCLLYILVVQLCIHYHRHLGFHAVQPIRILVICIGMSMLFYFFSHFESYLRYNLRPTRRKRSRRRPPVTTPGLTSDDVHHIIEPLASAIGGLSERIDSLEHESDDARPSHRPFTVVSLDDKNEM